MQNCTDLDFNAYVFSYSAYQKPQDFPNPSAELHSCQCVLNVLLSLFHFKSRREEACDVTRGCRYLLGAAHGEAPGSSGQARGRLTRPLLWKCWIARSLNSGTISGCRMSTNGITKYQDKEQQWQRTQGSSLLWHWAQLRGIVVARAQQQGATEHSHCCCPTDCSQPSVGKNNYVYDAKP